MPSPGTGCASLARPFRIASNARLVRSPPMSLPPLSLAAGREAGGGDDLLAVWAKITLPVSISPGQKLGTALIIIRPCLRMRY